MFSWSVLHFFLKIFDGSSLYLKPITVLMNFSNFYMLPCVRVKRSFLNDSLLYSLCQLLCTNMSQSRTATPYLDQTKKHYSRPSGFEDNELPIAVPEQHRHMIVVTQSKSSLHLCHKRWTLKKQYITRVCKLSEFKLPYYLNLAEDQRESITFQNFEFNKAS